MSFFPKKDNIDSTNTIISAASYTVSTSSGPCAQVHSEVDIMPELLRFVALMAAVDARQYHRTLMDAEDRLEVLQ